MPGEQVRECFLSAEGRRAAEGRSDLTFLDSPTPVLASVPFPLQSGRNRLEARLFLMCRRGQKWPQKSIIVAAQFIVGHKVVRKLIDAAR